MRYGFNLVAYIILSVVLVLVATGYASGRPESPVVTVSYKTLGVTDDRAVFVAGAITAETAEKESIRLMQIATGPGNIYLFINSPGGDFDAANRIINAMIAAQQRHNKIVCIGAGLVMSAAFHIFTACDERYIYPGTTLMFHSVVVGINGIARIDELKLLINKLEQINSEMLVRIAFSTGINRAIISENFYKETLWSADTIIKAAKPGWAKKLLINSQN